jgi:hypothetical protein
MRRPATKWSGSCSWCGVPGDASSLFCYSASTGELAAIWDAANPPQPDPDDPNPPPPRKPRKIESRFQFCDASKTDCLDQWLRRVRAETVA